MIYWTISQTLAYVNVGGIDPELLKYRCGYSRFNPKDRFRINIPRSSFYESLYIFIMFHVTLLLNVTCFKRLWTLEEKDSAKQINPRFGDWLKRLYSHLMISEDVSKKVCLVHLICQIVPRADQKNHNGGYNDTSGIRMSPSARLILRESHIYATHKNSKIFQWVQKKIMNSMNIFYDERDWWDQYEDNKIW